MISEGKIQDWKDKGGFFKSITVDNKSAEEYKRLTGVKKANSKTANADGTYTVYTIEFWHWDSQAWTVRQAYGRGFDELADAADTLLGVDRKALTAARKAEREQKDAQKTANSPSQN